MAVTLYGLHSQSSKTIVSNLQLGLCSVTELFTLNKNGFKMVKQYVFHILILVRNISSLSSKLTYCYVRGKLNESYLLTDSKEKETE